jgi:hypothetical protein
VGSEKWVEVLGTKTPVSWPKSAPGGKVGSVWAFAGQLITRHQQDAKKLPVLFCFPVYMQFWKAKATTEVAG